MVSICPLLWQRDVKLQQTNNVYMYIYLPKFSIIYPYFVLFPLIVIILPYY